MLQEVSAAVQEQLLRHRRDYARHLEEELTRLRNLAAERGEGGHDPANWMPVRDRLHRLAGSAGTFGFTAIGETCRRLERRLSEGLDGVSPGAFDEVRRGLLAIDAQAASAPDKAPADDIVSVGLERPDPVRDGRECPLVFVLEQEAEVGRQLCRVLESFHYAAEPFDSAAALQRACRIRRPDALILGIAAEGDTGDALAIGEAIQDGMEPDLPLFVIAPSRDFASQLRAVRAGVEAFLTRPLEPLRLADALEASLRQHRLPPPRVLMVDDDEALLAHHRLVLDAVGFSVMTCSRPEQALEAMDAFTPDVLVLDVRMPGCSGPELAQIVRYHSRWLQVPIVYLSAAGDAGMQLSAMTKAGDDFLVKPIAAEALVASVTARARRARALAAALVKDGLTGLLKHADVKERLATALAQARRQRQPLCAVMLDIDHFKRVNDSFGHLTGDEVIRALANLLRRRLRESDLIGRYGGEEFLVVLHDCAQPQAVQVIDELREAFAGLEFSGGEEGFSCSFSAGVVEATPDHDGDIDGLIGEADRYLYLAKRAGRNRVIAAGP